MMDDEPLPRLRMLRPLRRRSDLASKRFRRGVYLLPSMFTMGNMFCGYCCIIFAIRGEFATAEEVRVEVLKGTDLASRLNNAAPASGARSVAPSGVQRIAEVPIHFADALARRSEPLQLARDSAPPTARMSRALMQRLGLLEGERVRVYQEGGEAVLTAVEDNRVPAECVRICAAHPTTANLGDMFGVVMLERIPVGETVSA